MVLATLTASIPLTAFPTLDHGDSWRKTAVEGWYKTRLGNLRLSEEAIEELALLA